MLSQNFQSSQKHQRGIGIVEVLVALVVVSLGVLGMASLQLTGMQQSSGSYNRAKALLYAENMATRMRTNPVEIERATKFSNFDAAGLSCAVSPVPYCQTSDSGEADECSTSDMADFDMFTVACGDWGDGGADSGVKGSLPGGNMTIVCDESPCTPISTYTLAVTWVEGNRRTEDMDDSLLRQVQMKMRP